MEDVYQILVKEDRWMTQKEIVEVSGLNKTGVSTSMRSLVSRILRFTTLDPTIKIL